MLVSLWSAKGGVGVSVTAALLALRAGRREPQGALLVDLCGDQPLVLGIPEPRDGLSDWLAADARSPTALGHAAVDVGHGLALLPRGAAAMAPTVAEADAAVGLLADHPATVVVDAGCVAGDEPRLALARRFAAAATRSILVTRPCYLALARVRELPLVPSAVVLVREPHRSLGVIDVESAVGAPVAAVIDIDAGIARSVDAGLVRGRPPRRLDRALDGVL